MKQQLSDAIEDYLAFRKSQDYSKLTVKNERSTLLRFLTVVGNIQMHNIQARHITRFFEEIAPTKQTSSLANDHGRLTSFFAWARHTKRMRPDQDPMFGRRVPKARQKERYRIHVSKFPRLLELAGESDPRNRALVAVLLYTLMRDQEAADLTIGDVDLDAGYITARIHKSRTEDRVPISAELDQELRTWLKLYAEEVGHLHDHYYLLPSRKSLATVRDDARGVILGHEWQYLPERKLGAAGRVIHPILEKLGVPVRTDDGKRAGEGAHTLRRSGARALFDSLNDMGYDRSLRVVQAMLHHSSQQTTELYIGVTADRRTRDDLIRGKFMYGSSRENVISLAR